MKRWSLKDAIHAAAVSSSWRRTPASQVALPRPQEVNSLLRRTQEDRGGFVWREETREAADCQRWEARDPLGLGKKIPEQDPEVQQPLLSVLIWNTKAPAVSEAEVDTQAAYEETNWTDLIFKTEIQIFSPCTARRVRQTWKKKNLILTVRNWDFTGAISEKTTAETSVSTTMWAEFVCQIKWYVWKMLNRGLILLILFLCGKNVGPYTCLEEEKTRQHKGWGQHLAGAPDTILYE